MHLNTPFFLAILYLFSLKTAWAGSINAVIELKEEPWYQNLVLKNGVFGLKKGYAPFPVFFAGWKSGRSTNAIEPTILQRESIVSYQWWFGDTPPKTDGSPDEVGMNVTHVYEKVGVFKARLKVIDQAGNVGSSETTITVIDAQADPDPAKRGRIFYVDSVSGNDINSGLTLAGAFKTAARAFKGMVDKTYRPGDRILFRRGQTFLLPGGVIHTGHGSSWGYVFGTYGSGEKPIIKRQGISTEPLIAFNGADTTHVVFVNLVFDSLSAEGVIGNIVQTKERIANLLFLRVDFKNFNQAFAVDFSDWINFPFGIFVVSSTTSNLGLTKISDALFFKSNLHMYFKAKRVAIVGNNLDYSNNHLIYGAWVDTGTFMRNTFNHSANGRTQLRLSSASGNFSVASRNNYVAKNSFVGWLDPYQNSPFHEAGRYNQLLLQLAPNRDDIDEGMENTVVEDNIFENAEIFIKIGCYDNLIVRRNIMKTDSISAGAERILIGSAFDHRPVKNIKLIANHIVTNENRVGQGPTIRVAPYTREAYGSRINHEQIYVIDNVITMKNDMGRYLILAQAFDYKNQFFSKGNKIYALSSLDLIQIGGSYNNPGILYDILQWQALYLTGTVYDKDVGSIVQAISLSPDL